MEPHASHESFVRRDYWKRHIMFREVPLLIEPLIYFASIGFTSGNSHLPSRIPLPGM